MIDIVALSRYIDITICIPEAMTFLSQTIVLESQHLRLLPCTLPMIQALQSRSENIESLFGATVPDTWPQHELREALPFFTAALERDPESYRWLVWAVELKSESVVIGDAGFKGVPQNGRVELGYSILPQYRSHGYATEAAKTLLNWALRQDGVEKVIARCDVRNAASVRVLEKAGMSRVRTDENTLLWEYQKAQTKG